MAATGMARNFGKTASGSVSAKATAVSPSSSMPRTSRARPSAKSAAPAIGSSGQTRPLLV